MDEIARSYALVNLRHPNRPEKSMTPKTVRFQIEGSADRAVCQPHEKMCLVLAGPRFPNPQPPSEEFCPIDALGEDDTAIRVLHALKAAVILARGGDRSGARWLCASFVYEAQPLIVARTGLLRTTIYALLVVHGFRLLSHVVMAINGCIAQVTLASYGMGQIKLPEIYLEARRIYLPLDPRWLDSLSVEDLFLCRLCEALGREITFEERSIVT
jgi:hypothetical protein